MSNLLEKYRPRNLGELLGQPWASQQLQLFATNNYSAAFLFEGDTGTGKTSATLLLAEALGVQIDQGPLGGLHQIASGEQTGETVRRMMESVRCRPFFGSGWKVLVVNEADAMTPNAAFVWLDALEDIPPHTVIICTTNAAGRMTSATDRIGQRIAYNYDLLNRETGESWYNAGGTQVNTLTFTYDANDNLLTAANNTARSTMTYDALDRTASVQAPFGAVLTYSYDTADNRTLVQDSFGATTTRTYDVLNRVTTMQFGGSGQTPLREDFTYTARDQVATQTRYSDLAGTSEIGSSTFSYDSVRRLTNLQHLNGAGSNLANYTNTYDLTSRITAETLNGSAPTSYSYDATHELTNDSQVTYTYDLNGNRTMTGYATGPANELTSDGTWNYFYDKNGNRIGKQNPSTGEVFSYGYDNRNRLVSAQDTTTSGVQMQATYVYDSLGQRIEKDVGTGSTTTTRFAYDRREIWTDLSSTNTLQTRYVRGEQLLELLARIVSGTAAWFLADRMRSVRNVVDQTGTVIDTISYDGFGNATNETSPANGGQYRYNGYRLDTETWLLRPDPTAGRYYDAVTGRWMSEDPLGIVQDSNLYRYVRNKPTNSVDPFGLWDIKRKSNESVASATSEAGDTIRGLAKIIGLDSDVFKNWLSWAVPIVNYKLFQDDKYYPMDTLKERTQLAAGQCFLIPNTIIGLWIGDLGKLGKGLVNWQGNMRYLKRLGFHVAEIIYKWTPVAKKGQAVADFLETLTVGTRSKILHGLYVWGHGDDVDASTRNAIATKFSSFYVTYAAMGKALKYKLGFVVLNVCFGAAGKQSLSSQFGNYVFEGRPGALLPFVNAYDAWNVIKPGQQGTDVNAPPGKPPLFGYPKQ